MKAKYYNIIVIADCGLFDVVACSVEAAIADVSGAFHNARIITTIWGSEVC